jgi:6-pyruvoyltetrahydropterin/6-carboxytetrahydropterin synthase
MFTISKQFHFCASHIIEGVPEDHPCGRLHGHNYLVEIVLKCENLDQIGFVVDYHELKPFRDLLDQELDHRHLNDILPGSTSAESIAYYLYQRAKKLWPQVFAIRVSETPKTWAEYSE